MSSSRPIGSTIAAAAATACSAGLADGLGPGRRPGGVTAVALTAGRGRASHARTAASCLAVSRPAGDVVPGERACPSRCGGDRRPDAVAHLDVHGVAHVVDVLDAVAQHLPAQPALEVGDQRGVVGVDHVQRDVELPLVRGHRRGGRPDPVPHVDQHRLADVVDVVDLVVQHGAAQAPLQVRDQRGVVGVDHVEVDVRAPGALAQRLAVDDRHRAQQQDVDQHDQPTVGDVHPVDQAHHQGDEVVGDLLLGHRVDRSRMIDRIAKSPKPSAMSTRTLAQQRDRHEDADVERDVAQQQVRAPMAAEVQHVGQ